MRTPTWPSHPKPSSSCRSRTWPTATMPMRHAPSSARSRHTDAGRTSTSIAMPWNRGWRHSNRGTRAMRCAAFTRLYALRFAKPRWGDKTPGYVKHTRAVQDLLPEARFIHIIRDGRDVAVSLIEEWRASGRVMSVTRAAERWVSKISVGREQARELRFYLEVRYEDLVLDSESVLRRICDFIDLPWHPDMLEYHRSAPERVAELVAPDAPGTLSSAQRQAKHAWPSS